MMAGTLGWIIDAPAATAYAVLPVGVETIKPNNKIKIVLNNLNILTALLYRKEELQCQKVKKNEVFYTIKYTLNLYN